MAAGESPSDGPNPGAAPGPPPPRGHAVPRPIALPPPPSPPPPRPPAVTDSQTRRHARRGPGWGLRPCRLGRSMLGATGRGAAARGRGWPPATLLALVAGLLLISGCAGEGAVDDPAPARERDCHAELAHGYRKVKEPRRSAPTRFAFCLLLCIWK